MTDQTHDPTAVAIPWEIREKMAESTYLIFLYYFIKCYELGNKETMLQAVGVSSGLVE